MFEALLSVFVFFFAVIDPIGSVPVFIAVTTQSTEEDKRRIAIKSTFVAALVLVFFVVAGELIFNAIDIPLSAMQIAGGIVLFLFALTMIFGDSKPDEEVKLVNKGRDKAIFPLAVPSIASPGAMLGAVLMTENGIYSFMEQFLATLMMLAVLVIVLILLLLAGKVHRFIGDGGSSVISRVMGIILASVAIANVLEGIKVYFGL